jgi:molybdenum cofactor cytidylyltransferase
VKFGPVPTRDAVGGIVAHSLKEGGLVLKKGVTVTADHVKALLAAGVAEVTVARLEPGDIPEDVAAARLADAVIDVEVVSETPFTGRVNLFAASPGVLLIDAAKIDAVNDVDEAVTIATLPHFRRVGAGEMIATVKIIPFAVREDRRRRRGPGRAVLAQEDRRVFDAVAGAQILRRRQDDAGSR